MQAGACPDMHDSSWAAITNSRCILCALAPAEEIPIQKERPCTKGKLVLVAHLLGGKTRDFFGQLWRGQRLVRGGWVRIHRPSACRLCNLQITSKRSIVICVLECELETSHAQNTMHHCSGCLPTCTTNVACLCAALPVSCMCVQVCVYSIVHTACAGTRLIRAMHHCNLILLAISHRSRLITNTRYEKLRSSMAEQSEVPPCIQKQDKFGATNREGWHQ